MPPIRPSLTLQQAAEVSRRRAAGEIIYSLSSPTFDERGTQLAGTQWSTRLGPAAGFNEVRALARQELFGRWNLPAHECWIAAGTKAAIYSILRRVAAPGRSATIVAPNWPAYDELCRLCFLEPRHFCTELDSGFELDVERLDAFVSQSGTIPAAILLSNPANPTGKVYPARTIDALAALAARRRVALILDESFSGSVRDVAAWSRGPRPASGSDFVYVINSFSKNYHLQGLRVAACLCPGDVLGDLINIHQALSSSASTLSQAAVLALASLKNDQYSFAALEAQWQLMRSFMTRHSWSFIEPQGTFHCFPRVADPDGFARLAARCNVSYLRGDAFGTPYGSFLRLCFAKPLAELETIFRLLDSSGSP